MFKDIERNAPTYWTIKDEEDSIDLLIAAGKLENRPTVTFSDSFFILKMTDTICNTTDSNREISHDTFSFVHIFKIEFLRLELIVENKITESWLLSQLMLRDEFFASKNLLLAKFQQKGYVIINLFIIVINLLIQMKHCSDKINLLKIILSMSIPY